MFEIDFDMNRAMLMMTHECAIVDVKTRALSRAELYFWLMIDIMLMYKLYVLLYIEYHTFGLYVAPTCHSNIIDNLQKQFLRKINIFSKMH